MENQQPDINYSRTNGDKRIGLWNIFTPILVNYLISIVVQFIVISVLTLKELMRYVRNTPEIQSLMANTELGYGEMVERMNDIMTTEVTEQMMHHIIENFTNNIAFIAVISGIISIPVFAWMYKRDKYKFIGMNQLQPRKQVWWKYLLIIIGALAVGIALNNFINVIQLARLSARYEDASKVLYSVSLPMQLIAWGVLIPIAEECMFRGVIYNRLKLMVNAKLALIWSALIFGAYHGNIVQSVYTVCCGVMFVWVYERYGSMKAPIIAHVTLNISAIALTQSGVFYWIIEDPVRMGIVTVFCATLAATMYVVIQNTTIWISQEDSTSN